MTDTALVPRDPGAEIEKVLITGNLAELTPEQRVHHYLQVCESLGLNRYTRPFEYITFDNKLTLYVGRSGTDQLRKIHGVSITRIERDKVGDVYCVTAHAVDRTGRQDASTGIVAISRGLGGKELANAMMRAETKAKRRVTLSLCGLGWADESEIDSIPGAHVVDVDPTTGEVLEDWTPTREREVEDRNAPERAPNVPKATYELYRGLLARARRIGAIDDAAPWVMRSDATEAEIVERGKELRKLVREKEGAPA
jgi:hypothetical protein